MLVIMLAFFATIVSVNVGLAWFAASTWTGTVVQNSYVASQHFNELLAKARRQRRLGWSPSLHSVDGVLRAVVLDRQGRPLRELRLVARMSRPLGTTHDHAVTLRQQADGSYSAADILSAGLWDAELMADGNAGETARWTFRLEIAGK
jgi:nitrogen fixation protein FixH